MTIKINLNDFDKIKSFTTDVCKFESDVDVFKDSNKNVYDAKSLLSLYSIDLSKPIMVRIISKNSDEIERFKRTMQKYT